MFYSSGNYEAFPRPRKPAGVEHKTAWFVGSGLASLAGAAFLIRDGHMPAKQITILEELQVPGGALDGIEEPEKGFVIRGGREMEDHFECLWDLFRSIPSLEIDGASVLDEFYWLNKDDPNHSLRRTTIDQGQGAPTDGLFTLSDAAQKDLVKLFLATRKEMENRRINEVLGEDFLASNFWLYWRTMFAFEEWHSALEMKLYLHRFIHHIGGLADFSTLKFTRHNQYESLVLPLVSWLRGQGVVFQYNTVVTDVAFAAASGRKQATHIRWTQHGAAGGVELGPDDLVFMTIGSLTENSSSGDHHTPAALNQGPAPAWDLWRRIAAQDPAFGRPDVFGAHIPETKWASATITTLDKRIPGYTLDSQLQDSHALRADLVQQRDRLQESHDRQLAEIQALQTRHHESQVALQIERERLEAHMRAVEDRAHQEIDRARQDAKQWQQRNEVAERSRREAIDTAQKRYDATSSEARHLEQEVARQAGQITALEKALSEAYAAAPPKRISRATPKAPEPSKRKRTPARPNNKQSRVRR
jgi:hypothetical protein